MIRNNRKKEDLEKKLKTAERKVEILEALMEDRTRELYLSQQKLQMSVKDLEKSNLQLQKKKEEFETLVVGLEERVRERTAELTTLYEVSNAISYTLDYQQVIKLIMEALFKVVRYDICASLLYDDNTAALTMRPVYPQSLKLLDEVRENLLDSASTVSGEDIRKRLKSTYSIPPIHYTEPKRGQNTDKLRTFFNVPYIVGGKPIGMINVSSCKEDAFSEDDIRFVYTIANQASNAIERLQAVVSAERLKMESMVESMSEGLVMVDEYGKLVLLNPQARGMLGFEVDEEISDTVFEDRLAYLAWDDAIKECREKGKVVTREVEVSGKSNLVLKCNISPIKDIEGNIIGVVAILRDVSDEKEIDRMKTEFISTVSHELRTPLTITKEGVRLILDRVTGEINAKQEKVLNTAQDNIDRLARIINNLLDISKIEARKLELKRASVDMPRLVRRVASSFEPQIEQKGLALKIKVSDKISGAYADEDQIAQVITNLVGNALKFTKKGQINVSVAQKGNEIECVISDTGIGIVKSDIPLLFDKFKQFGRKPGSGEKGTGLGLSIVKGIVEMHKGRIWVESKKDKGSSFYFTLPEYRAEEHLYERFGEQLKKASESEVPLTIIIVTLKDIYMAGQKYGEEKINEVVTKIMGIMKSQLRSKDIVVGYRNNEIMVGLPQMGEMQAKKVVQRIIDAFSKERLDMKLVLATGVASYPKDGEVVAELIHVAQNNLTTVRVPMRNVLVIDDDIHFVDILKEWLQGLGLNVMAASTGEAGIKLAGKGDSDLIVLDMRLPGMSGYEVIGHLKADMRTQDLPIIFTSAYEVDKRVLYTLAPSTIPVFEKAEGFEKLTDMIKGYTRIV